MYPVLVSRCVVEKAEDTRKFESVIVFCSKKRAKRPLVTLHTLLCHEVSSCTVIPDHMCIDGKRIFTSVDQDSLNVVKTGNLVLLSWIFFKQRGGREVIRILSRIPQLVCTLWY